ncbi:ubiquitin carboxyl-terminal hydrolase 18-like isoform X2 [Salvia miltiorrhiza]|nr:ubiquitin carboxyl-terminal hydrolase 18-like isoform X2 [Salvia miltiorrhiza]XP_057795463.1 ubiquitin carboxyl-terminal hydrolase 18-like isoform X2 [Salvia miltiorrhiza]
MEFFNWEKLGYPPCGLINAASLMWFSSVLYTPVNMLATSAYILEKGHKLEYLQLIKCYLFIDEFGGEKTAHPRYEETSFVQHIFGGCLQSELAPWDDESLEECLDQFTVEGVDVFHKSISRYQAQGESKESAFIASNQLAENLHQPCNLADFRGSSEQRDRRVLEECIEPREVDVRYGDVG